MWIGKRATRWTIVLAALLLVACQTKSASEDRQDAPVAAWWYKIDFRPTATTVRGIDVRRIDEGWKRASALDASLLEGRISENDIRQLEKSALSFTLLSDIDGDRVSEEFFVGVYEAADGEKGRFVAVTRKGRVLQYFKERGSTGFSALLQGDGEVRWYKCMECGEFESIKWSGQSYVLE